MKSKELRGFTVPQIKERIGELEKELMKLNAQVATGTNPKSPGRVGQIKKTIAQFYTIQHEKENKL